MFICMKFTTNHTPDLTASTSTALRFTSEHQKVRFYCIQESKTSTKSKSGKAKQNKCNISMQGY